jgi:hypothetical protein
VFVGIWKTIWDFFPITLKSRGSAIRHPKARCAARQKRPDGVSCHHGISPQQD